eukprot:6192013-Prymnesium_polylepis.2
MQESGRAKQRRRSIVEQLEATGVQECSIDGHHTDWPEHHHDPRDCQDLRMLRRIIAPHGEIFSHEGMLLDLVERKRDTVPSTEYIRADRRRCGTRPRTSVCSGVAKGTHTQYRWARQNGVRWVPGAQRLLKQKAIMSEMGVQFSRLTTSGCFGE